MSWEGYDQVLCEKGHHTTVRLGYMDEPNYWGEVKHDEYKVPLYCGPHWKCDCGAEAIWWNQVDTTNGSFEYEGEEEIRIDGYVDLEDDQEAEWHECSCGNRHVVKDATFKVPSSDLGHHRD